MNDGILTIDGGTQSTKVAIFDLLGNEICSETVPLQELHLYGNGRAEHPDDDLWHVQDCWKNSIGMSMISSE